MMLRLVRYSCAIGLVLAVSMVARADLADGLISAWTFDDGTARDALGVSDGKLIDGAKIVDGGKFGKALDVDGVTAYVEVPHKPAYNVMENAFSVSAWMYVRAGRNHSAIIWKGEKIGWGDLYLLRVATTSDTGMTWGTCPVGVEGWFATDNVYTTNEWTHVAMTVDGTTAIAYVNAEVPPSGQGNPHGVAGPYQLFEEKPFEMGVGRSVGGNVGNDSFLDGLIDEVYIWDRALTEDEIKALANGERPASALAVSAKQKLATTWGDIKSLQWQ